MCNWWIEEGLAVGVVDAAGCCISEEPTKYADQIQPGIANRGALSKGLYAYKAAVWYGFGTNYITVIYSDEWGSILTKQMCI